MLKRFYVYFLLSVLFAIAQTGIATHEISHINELTQQSQPDKKQGNEPCALCISLAHAAGALTQTPQWHLPPLSQVTLPAAAVIAVNTYHVAVYSARAPPFMTSA